MKGKPLSIALLLVGVISLVMGGFFIFQGFAKSAMILEAMQIEKASYDGVDGVIDSPGEAQTMAGILREHRLELGYYTELARNDPNRDTILKGMTLENSLNLAELGFGLTDVVKATGVFMLLIGATLGTLAVSIRPQGKGAL